MSSNLEQQYRSGLRWYSRKWRAAHEEAMLGTLLDVAEAEARARPAPGEVNALKRSGLATRADRILPASVRDGVSAVSMATGAAFATIYFVMHSWMPWLDIATLRDGATGLAHPTFGPFLNPFVLLYAVWMIALILAAAGFIAATRITLAVSVATALLIPLASTLTGTLWFGPRATNLGFLCLLALFAMLGVPRRPVRLLVGVAVATAAMTGYYLYWGYLSRGGDDLFFWYNPGSATSVQLYLTISGAVALAFLFARRSIPATVTIVSLVPWLGPWLIWSSPRGDFANAITFIVGGAIVAALLGTVGLALHRSGIRVSVGHPKETPRARL